MTTKKPAETKKKRKLLDSVFLGWRLEEDLKKHPNRYLIAYFSKEEDAVILKLIERGIMP